MSGSAAIAEKYKAAPDCCTHKSVEQESSPVCQEIKKVKVTGNLSKLEKEKMAFLVRKSTKSLESEREGILSYN